MRWVALSRQGRAEAGGEAEFGAVGDGERLVVVPHPDHAGDRAEDLLAADAPVVRRPAEKRGRKEDALGPLPRPFAADAPGALVLADRDLRLVLLQ